MIRGLRFMGRIMIRGGRRKEKGREKIHAKNGKVRKMGRERMYWYWNRVKRITKHEGSALLLMFFFVKYLQWFCVSSYELRSG